MLTKDISQLSDTISNVLWDILKLATVAAGGKLKVTPSHVMTAENSKLVIHEEDDGTTTITVSPF